MKEKGKNKQVIHLENNDVLLDLIKEKEIMASKDCQKENQFLNF